jgi:hypothetical protein
MSQISFIARAMTSWKPLHVSGTVLQIIEEFVLVLRIRTFLGLPLKEVLRRENQGLKICPVDGF